MDKYKNGKIVIGCVTGIENYGIFVSLNQDYSGLIHISEISEHFVRNVGDYVTMGETINVQILEIDEDKHHMKLSIKDIDYRRNKQKKARLAETKLGFTTLKEMLPKWVEMKEMEIMLKNR